MTRCYSAGMGKRQTVGRCRGGKRALRAVPHCIVLTDARNDAMLERAIRRLPQGSAVVFRHYHLDDAARRRRFSQVRAMAAGRGLVVIGARVPGHWHANGVYGSAREVAGAPGLKLATAHCLREIGAAARAGADAILLSPVFPTRSHPGAAVLGSVRFLLLARLSPLPVVALGGMTRARARRLPVHGWAAIDGIA